MPVGIVTLWKVPSGMPAARLLPLQGAEGDHLGQVEHILELQEGYPVGIVHLALILEAAVLHPLLQLFDLFDGGVQPLSGAEHPDITVHDLPQLVADGVEVFL